MPFEVETRSLDDQATAIGAAGPYTVKVDRPASAGGGGLGFNGGEPLYLAVAGCVSNDLFREAQAAGIASGPSARAWRLHRRPCRLDRDHL
jgi:putative redox protein